MGSRQRRGIQNHEEPRIMKTRSIKRHRENKGGRSPWEKGKQVETHSGSFRNKLSGKEWPGRPLQRSS